MSNNRLLITQSFIVDDPDSYWDYRDYIFSLCSNLEIKNETFRLNIERDIGWVDEFNRALNYYNFTDFEITGLIPKSWSEYIINQINNNHRMWTMLFPGDHIFINEDKNLLNKILDKAEKLEADAVAYSHIQDWDYLLDWDIIDILYEDKDSIMIYWGHKYKHYRNHKFCLSALKKIKQFLIVPPVPGYMIYRSNFLLKILKSLPLNNKRWQDMEYSPAKETKKYKVLIPKKCLYRHVHGYWLELYLQNKNKIVNDKEREKLLKSIYIKTEYNWIGNTPTTKEYKELCIEKNPYFNKYFNSTTDNKLDNYIKTPFDNAWPVNYTKLKKLNIYFKKIIYYYFLNNLSKIKKAIK